MLAKIHMFQNRILHVVIIIAIASVTVLTILFSYPTPAAQADTPVCGPIDSNTTWMVAGSPYIVTCNVQVVNGINLTIQPGTVVKFDLNTSLIVDGELIAQEVTFTSNDSIPADGDWDHIVFNPTSVDAVFDAQGNYVSGSLIQDSLLEFGGDMPASGVIEINLASPFIHQNIIRNIDSNGDAILAIGRSPSQLVQIVGNFIGPDAFLGEGISITNGQAMSNTISNNGGTGIVATNSTLNGNNIIGNDRGIDAIGSVITANTISSNDAYGGIDATSSTITGNVISGNSGSDCGGIDARGNSIVAGNFVSNNSATSSLGEIGGGICADGGTVTGNTITGNSATGRGGGIYAINATVHDNTVSGNSASDGGGIYGDSANLFNNTVINNNASDDGGGIYVLHNSTVANNVVELNSGDAGGGIFASINFSANLLELTGNQVTQNNANYGGGIYADGNYLSDIHIRLTGNTVLTNTAQLHGGGIYATGSVVESNLIAHNTVPNFGRGSGAYVVGDVEFTYNNVLTNMASGGTVGGVSIEGQPSQLQFNNIYGNAPFDAEVISADDVDGSLNYWGQSNCLEIVTQIYDGDDMPGRGELTYAPSLYEPVAMTQFTAPENLQVTVNDDSVTLTWDAVPDLPDVGCRPTDGTLELGYRLYYDTEGNCTFDGTALTQGDSPIDVGEGIEITLTGLSQQNDYYFAVVAYDYLERESPYSNLEAVLSGLDKIFLPFIEKDNL